MGHIDDVDVAEQIEAETAFVDYYGDFEHLVH